MNPTTMTPEMSEWVQAFLEVTTQASNCVSHVRLNRWGVLYITLSGDAGLSMPVQVTAAYARSLPGREARVGAARECAQYAIAGMR